MKNSSNILLGILGAAAAGVVIGMILAPEKGEDLRSDIKNSTGDFTRKLGDLLSRGREKYDELRTMIGEEGKELKHDAKAITEEAGKAYKDFTAKAEQAFSDFSHEANNAYKKVKS